MIKRVVRIRLQEEENEAVKNRIYVEDRFPVLAQNVQTHISFKVDIGVVQRSVALSFGGFMGVRGRHRKSKAVLASFPEWIFIFEVNCDVDCVGVLLVGLARAMGRNVDFWEFTTQA